MYFLKVYHISPINIQYTYYIHCLGMNLYSFLVLELTNHVLPNQNHDSNRKNRLSRVNPITQMKRERERERSFMLIKQGTKEI